jgi:molybdate transport system substrate-binding protein
MPNLKDSLLRATLLFVLSLWFGTGLPSSAQAAEVRLAVAANFSDTARQIADRFEARSGHRVVISAGSSGQLFAQIRQGAPFDVFLSADSERPARAEAEGLGVKGTRFTYATGRLVLWSRTPGLVDPQGRVLAKGRFQHLAVADPASAPYGRAAMEVLTRRKLTARLTPYLVTGSSIAQTLQFVRTGSAELGFIALSQAKSLQGGSRWLVPATDHSPIDQQAILLTHAADRAAAAAFLKFLKGPEARRMIIANGYEVH